MADVHDMRLHQKLADLTRTVDDMKLKAGGKPPYDGDMEHRVTALETRLDTILPTLATKGDIGDVRTDIQKGIGETHKWMIATVIGLFLGFGGLFLAMSTALKPGPQPTIVYAPPQK